MITLKNVTKIYKIKNKSDCIAVNNVTLEFKDKGMIFIIGKSGSGKSTLLNLIGGLDKCSSGEIIADGNNITKMESRKVTKYRSSYVGFIFQDYHVLDNFTVRENVNLALDITSQEDDEKVNRILNLVDLNMYVDRYPTELSGGQKQRIAIARALVKDSKVILCDEPTGNLDKKTSTQILELLKKISQEKLVIIVSHNMVDASTYADRIIELSDGQVIRDRRRSENYNNEFKIENDIVYLPHYRDLTSNELIILNEEIQANDNLSFKQINNRFYETTPLNQKMEKVELVSSKMSRKTSKKLFKMFFRHKKVSMAISVFLVSLLVVCFAIFQSFLNFNSNEELSKTLEKHDIETIPLQKGEFNAENNVTLGYLKDITDEEIQSFYDCGFKGNIYMKYNNTLPLSYSSTYLDSEHKLSISTLFTMFYTKETLGVIQCDEEFLISLFGENNELKMLAGGKEGKEYGVLIPDYIADSMLFYNSDKTLTYDDLIGEYYFRKVKYGYVNGIFDTNYEEKYKAVIDKYQHAFENPNEVGKIYKQLIDDETFNDFLVYAMTYLGYGYTFNKNYATVLESNEFRDIIKLSRYEFKKDEETKNFNSTTIVFYDDEFFKELYPSYKKAVPNLKNNEIVLGITIYNRLFGTSYTSNKEFTPHPVTFTFYENHEKEGKILFQKEYQIVSLVTGSSCLMEIDDNFDLRKFDVIKYGMILDNQDNISEVALNADKKGFLISSVDATQISTINRVLEVFDDFFIFIEMFFFLIMIIFLVNIGISSIKKNRYEIGVLRAIGTSGRDIIKIFIRQSVLVCIAISIVANIGIFIGEKVANFILVEAFEKVLNITFNDLVLINYIPKLVLLDLIYIIIISFISFIIPQISLFKIKPIDIIRAKE